MMVAWQYKKRITMKQKITNQKKILSPAFNSGSPVAGTGDT
jgi:hypothetical protein